MLWVWGMNINSMLVDCYIRHFNWLLYNIVGVGGVDLKTLTLGYELDMKCA